MFTKKILAAAMMAALPLASMTLATPVQAQQYNREAPRGPVIRGFNVDEVRRLEPGVELNFDLYGSPGGSATIRIDGATRNLTLSETEPGQYEGSYTISTRDRIRPNSAVTANLREGNRVASQVLSAYHVTRKRRAIERTPPEPSESQKTSRHDELDDGSPLDF